MKKFPKIKKSKLENLIKLENPKKINKITLKQIKLKKSEIKL